VLLTFGLGTGLAPVFRPEPWGQPDLRVALVPAAPRQEKVAPAVRAKAAPGNVEAPLALMGKKKALLEEELAAADPTGRWPLPPEMRLNLVLRNPGPAPLEVQVGGPGFALVLELSGPDVLRRTSSSPASVPFPQRSLLIPPGGSERLVIDRLVSQVGGQRVEYLYPTAPGEYVLRARLSTVAWHPGRPASRRAFSVTAGPLKLAVSPQR
jgi:hypothetical protein